MKRVIAIALSGGIDSLVAAHLLKENGDQVLGIHFLTGFEDDACSRRKVRCLSNQLHIPITVLDLRQQFSDIVVDYFTQEYKDGRTPNPCMICNPHIKFGIVLDYALKLGASALATGHYARTEISSDKTVRLLKGADRKKEQSYFLAFLSQTQLSKVEFPLGNLEKSTVKKLADQYGLEPFTAGESQDICFIKGSYADFLSHRAGVESKPGIIEDVHGTILGRHRGLHHYTVGQRRGINCPAKEPYYVIRLDSSQNKLIVGFKSEGYATECRVTSVHWIDSPPRETIRVFVRIRYRHKAVASDLIPSHNHEVLIRFMSPQAAVTPGQGAVFYRGEDVIGAGIII